LPQLPSCQSQRAHMMGQIAFGPQPSPLPFAKRSDRTCAIRVKGPSRKSEPGGTPLTPTPLPAAGFVKTRKRFWKVEFPSQFSNTQPCTALIAAPIRHIGENDSQKHPLWRLLTQPRRRGEGEVARRAISDGPSAMAPCPYTKL